MTLDCEAYGPQVFGIGGRIHWPDDQDAGCYTMPAFIYDVNSGSSRTKFDVSCLCCLPLLIGQLTR
jgi:hypothetical protein